MLAPQFEYNHREFYSVLRLLESTREKTFFPKVVFWPIFIPCEQCSSQLTFEVVFQVCISGIGDVLREEFEAFVIKCLSGHLDFLM